MGFTCTADACELLDTLCSTREIVATEFDALAARRPGAAAGNGNGGCRSCGPVPQPVDSEAFIERLPPALGERVRRWSAQPRIQGLRDDSKLRLAKLIGRARSAVQDARCTMDAAIRFVDWLEPLLRRESYLALLVERPEVHNRLLRLLGWRAGRSAT
jgi:glutamate-ammonia-ligase adenylyltransferase